jgi:hypothetical protein
LTASTTLKRQKRDKHREDLVSRLFKIPTGTFATYQNGVYAERRSIRSRLSLSACLSVFCNLTQTNYCEAVVTRQNVLYFVRRQYAVLSVTFPQDFQWMWPVSGGTFSAYHRSGKKVSGCLSLNFQAIRLSEVVSGRRLQSPGFRNSLRIL